MVAGVGQVPTIHPTLYTRYMDAAVPAPIAPLDPLLPAARSKLCAARRRAAHPAAYGGYISLNHPSIASRGEALRRDTHPEDVLDVCYSVPDLPRPPRSQRALLSPDEVLRCRGASLQRSGIASHQVGMQHSELHCYATRQAVRRARYALPRQALPVAVRRARYAHGVRDMGSLGAVHYTPLRAATGRSWRTMP